VGRSLVAELWSEHGRHALQPQPETREAAARLSLSAPSLEARGQTALETRWEMVSAAAGEVAAVGLEEVLVLDDRIRVDYQFIEP
jgi:hypothetical protein